MGGPDLLFWLSAAIVPAGFTLPFRAKNEKNFKWRWLAGMLLGWIVFSPVAILILKHHEDIRYTAVVERSKRGEHIEEWEWYDSPGGYFAMVVIGWFFPGAIGLAFGGVRFIFDQVQDRKMRSVAEGAMAK